MATGPISSSTSRCRNACASGGVSARRCQAVGLSLKICSVDAPISAARSTTRTRPRLRGRGAPARRPPGSRTRGVRAPGVAVARSSSPSARSTVMRLLPLPPMGPLLVASADLPAVSARRVLATDHRLDEPVIAALALVKHAQLLGLCVHEDEEEVAKLLHPLDGVLLEHRLDREALRLDDARSGNLIVGGDGFGEGVFASPDDLPGSRRVGSNLSAGLLAQIDGLALDSIQYRVQAGLIGGTRGVAADCLTIHYQGQLDYVRVGAAPMLLVRELDNRLRPLVLESFESTHLSVGVFPHGLWDIDVLALDDHPHDRPPKTRCASVAGR